MKKLLGILLLSLILIIPFASYADEKSVKVTDVKAVIDNTNRINISWEPVSEDGIYNIYVWNEEKKEYEKIGSCDGSAYSFDIKEYDKVKYLAVSLGEGEISDRVSVRTYAAKVTGLSASCDRNNVIKISWKKAKGADKYIVYKYSKTKKKYVVLAETKKTSFTDKNEPSDTVRKYKVAAYSKAGEAELSELEKIRTRAGKVSKLKAKGSDWNKIRISWKKAKGADGYRIYRWNGRKYVRVKTTSKTSWTDKGLNPHTRYSYKVASYSIEKNSKGKKCKKAGKYGIKVRAYTLKTVNGYRLGKPLKTMKAGSAYGWRGGAFHKGTDFLKPRGTKVYAATSGTVIRSKNHYGGLGKGIVIRGKNGITTWYGHLSKRIVKEGQHVKKGQLIGRVGSTGNAGSCNHLHFEVWINGNHYNPMKFY